MHSLFKNWRYYVDEVLLESRAKEQIGAAGDIVSRNFKQETEDDNDNIPWGFGAGILIG